MYSVAKRLFGGGGDGFIPNPNLGLTYNATFIGCIEYAVGNDAVGSIGLTDFDQTLVASRKVGRKLVKLPNYTTLSGDNALVDSAYAIAASPTRLTWLNTDAASGDALITYIDSLLTYANSSNTAQLPWPSGNNSSSPSRFSWAGYYLNNTYFYTGDDGDFLTSTNGSAWVGRSLSTPGYVITSVQWTGSRYVFILRYTQDSNRLGAASGYVLSLNSTFTDLQIANMDCKGVAYNGVNKYVALYTFGRTVPMYSGVRIHSTTDDLPGAQITMLSFPAKAIAFGNGVFVAITHDSAYTSTDGINWVLRTSSMTSAFSSGGEPPGRVKLKFLNGYFIRWIFGREGYHYSADGITWSANIVLAAMISTFAANPTSGEFLCVAKDGYTYSTTNITSAWTTRTHLGFSNMPDPGYGEAIFFPLANAWVFGRQGILVTSIVTSGTTWGAWTPAVKGVSGTTNWDASFNGFVNFAICKVTNHLVITTGIMTSLWACGADLQFYQGGGSSYSSDMSLNDGAEYGNEIYCLPIDNGVLAIGERGRAVSFWYLHAIPFYLQNPSTTNRNGGCAIVPVDYSLGHNFPGAINVNGIGVIAGSSGFHMSTNGFLTSTFVNLPSIGYNGVVQGIAYSAGVYCLSARGSRTSRDGYLLTAASLSGPWTVQESELYDKYCQPGQLLVFASKFFMIRGDGAISVSSNGTTWYTVGSYSDTKNSWLSIFRNSGTALFAYGGCAFAASITDGSPGANMSVLNTHIPMNYARARNKTQSLPNTLETERFVGVGEQGLVCFSTKASELNSANGTFLSPSFDFNAVRWSEYLGLWVAVGNGGAIYTNNGLGSGWVDRSLPPGPIINLFDVSCEGTKIVVVGNSTNVFVSTDGVTFTPVAAGGPSTAYYAAIYANGQYLIGGNNGAALKSSADALTWATSAISVLSPSVAVKYLDYSAKYATLLIGKPDLSDNDAGTNGIQVVGGYANGQIPTYGEQCVTTLGPDAIFSFRDAGGPWSQFEKSALITPLTAMITRSIDTYGTNISRIVNMQPIWAAYTDYKVLEKVGTEARTQQISAGYRDDRGRGVKKLHYSHVILQTP